MQNTFLYSVLVVLTAGGTTLMAQTSVEPLQERARAELVAGNHENAAGLAQTILAQSPDRFDALLVLALSQIELGQNAKAVDTATRAFQVAPSDATRVQAARLVAGAHSRQGQFTRAELWLRRAANNATTESEAEAIVREYITAVRENPLSVQFNAAIFPTDNVNGGSEDGILRLESIGLTLLLPESDQSLSGIGYGGGVDLTYRLSESPDHLASLKASLAGRTYTLSSESLDLLASSSDPEVRAVTGSDFSTAVASIGLELSDNIISPLGPFTITLDTGTYWEGGTRIIDFYAAGFEQAISIGESGRVNLAASFTDQTTLTPFLVDATVQDIRATYAHRFENGNQMQLNFAYRHNDGGFENIFDEYRFGVGFGLDQPVFGTQLSGAFEIGKRNYDEFVTTLDGRRDRFATVVANATFSEISYFGFSPGLSVSASRTESSAEENTTSTVQVLFGIESNF